MFTQTNVVLIQALDADRPDASSMPGGGTLFKPQGVDRLDILQVIDGVKTWVTVGSGSLGPAGGDLTGTYPDPLIANGVIVPAMFTTALQQKLGYVDVSFYVDSSTGSNSNPGTALLPFQTLAYAMSQLPTNPRGKCRIHLVGAGPYTFPEKWEGIVPDDFTGEPLMILGEWASPVKTGTLTNASAPNVTVAGGGMTVDAYRGLTYHGLTGTSANKYYTIAANSATQLTSVANTFGAGNTDTFEILTPLTVVTGSDLQLNGPGKIGFYACKFTNTTWEIVGDAATMFDACVFDSTSRFRTGYSSRTWFANTAQSPDFYFITDVGTQLGSTGAYFTPRNAQIVFDNRSMVRGWLVTGRTLQIDNQSTVGLFGVDIDVSALSGVNVITLDYGSLFRQNTGWARLVGGLVSGSGVVARHRSIVDLGSFTITGCITAAVNIQTQSTVNMLSVVGSSGNGAGVLISDGGQLSNAGGNTVSGTSGAILVDSSVIAIPWSEVGAILSSNPQVALKFTTTKTFAAHTALVAADRYVPLDSSGGAFAQVMPAANSVPPGTRIQVQDQAGQCTANPVTMTRAGADTFQGAATTFVINLNYAGATFQSDGTSVWYIVNRVLV